MNGIVIINKEKGVSSFGVVATIRRIFNTRKVGHCGTLDPSATGVLPIMIGNATKVSKYLVEHDKEYVATLKFGVKTSSGDSEGEIVCKDGFRLNADNEEIYRNRVHEFIGVQKQLPPMYSAIKVNGKKLYEYARAGKVIEREEREIEIYSINVESFNFCENEMVFRVSCSKGTYIRSLCESIAESFGTVGFMKDLVRTKVDNFSIEKSVKISELESCLDIKKHVISVEDVFANWKKIFIDEKERSLFLNGVKLSQNVNNGNYRVYCNIEFVGLGIVENRRLKRDVVIEK